VSQKRTELSEEQESIKSLKEEFNSLEGFKESGDLDKKIESLEKEISNITDWGSNKTREVLSKLNTLKEEKEKKSKIISLFQEVDFLLELLKDEHDESLVNELKDKVKELKVEIEEYKKIFFLSGEHDKSNAIVSLSAGAGGVDAMDWTQILLEMYLKWFQRKRFDFNIVEVSYGEEAGIKSATVIVKGDYAYGLLKGENGVHRLVRISPFDAAHRRHTSFALVEVVPEIPEEEIKINEDDLRIDVFRASGHGGQYVNKTDSAVRVVHIPTGIVVTCQSERSQLKNKETALKILYSKLVELKKIEKERKVYELKGGFKSASWGNQVRSYVFHPYTLVKDHRTGFETGNLEKVLNGEIDDFIWAYLRKLKDEKGKKEKDN